MQYKESHIVPVVVVTSGDVRALTTKKWGIRPPVISTGLHIFLVVPRHMFRKE